MIVGTAGHIDHGKTTLVRALTGVDTDRLPEEKRRGISIELGYAFLDADSDADSTADGAAGDRERIGFIDVPGHERLVHTMLAGATGIDYALLLVAADDGVMPQTREHLAVLAMLGIDRGAVVITKADRADAARIEAVCDEVAALVHATPLEHAPVCVVSAASGAGVHALRTLLRQAARDGLHREAQRGSKPRDAAAAFRLAIDRVFTLDGVGTVATGTVHAGTVRIGDTLAVSPDNRSLNARVRSLHAQNRSVDTAHPGQRCAAALVGVAKDDLARGQWLCAPEAALATDRLDATLTVWSGEAAALRSGTRVHVHLGSADVMGTVAVLQGTGADELAPGASGLVQIVLREAVGAWHGDRVVLRDAAATRVLGGGRVLDPYAPARYRRTPERLAELQAWQLATPADRLAALLNTAEQGVDLERWSRAQALARNQPPALPEGALRAADGEGRATHALGAVQAQELSEAVCRTLEEFHRRHQEELGPDGSRLRRQVAPRLPEALWRALLAKLVDGQAIAMRGSFVHLPEHGLRLTAADERLAQRVAPFLAAAAFEGSWARDLARDTGESEALMRTTLVRLAQGGELHQVVKDLYYADAVIAKLAAIARAAAAASQGEVSAAAFRDATGLGRKRAIQLLEYFDRVGLLRRVGDVHRLRSDTTLFVGAAA